MKLMFVKAYADQCSTPKKSDKTQQKPSTKSITKTPKEEQQEADAESPFGLVMFHFM